jgi:hypothetical protein
VLILPAAGLMRERFAAADGPGAGGSFAGFYEHDFRSAGARRKYDLVVLSQVRDARHFLARLEDRDIRHQFTHMGLRS